MMFKIHNQDDDTLTTTFTIAQKEGANDLAIEFKQEQQRQQKKGVQLAVLDLHRTSGFTSTTTSVFNEEALTDQIERYEEQGLDPVDFRAALAALEEARNGELQLGDEILRRVENFTYRHNGLLSKKAILNTAITTAEGTQTEQKEFSALELARHAYRVGEAQPFLGSASFYTRASKKAGAKDYSISELIVAP